MGADPEGAAALRVVLEVLLNVAEPGGGRALGHLLQVTVQPVPESPEGLRNEAFGVRVLGVCVGRGKGRSGGGGKNHIELFLN